MTHFYIQKYNPSWCSFIPVLLKIFPLSEGPILELGTGFFSTPILHMLCMDTNRMLISFENDRSFFDLEQKFINDPHQIIFTDDWDRINIDNTHWGMALVNHKPAERRVEEIRRLANIADFIIIHDSEPSQNHHYHYDLIYPLSKFRYDYQSKPRYAHTTVLSNLKDLSNLQIIFK